MEELRPAPPRLDIDALQEEITTLDGVRAVRVVATARGKISEVHVVANGGKQAKQLVRDIQTLALANFDIRIDHRIVSVVQFSSEIPEVTSLNPGHPRIELASMNWSTEGALAHVRVGLSFEGDQIISEVSGSATSLNRSRLVARATADALGELLGREGNLDVGDVVFTVVGGRRVCVVTAALLENHNELALVGSAIVRSDELEAVARAVLDAFNRPLSRSV